MKFTTVLASCFLAASALAASSISIQDGKLSVSAADGSSDSKFELNPSKKVSLDERSIQLEPDSVLKLAFTVVDSASGKGLVPQQSQLLYEDVKSGEVVYVNVPVKAKGKASYTLKATSIPASLLSSSGSYTLTLLLGQPGTITPLKYTFAKVTLPTTTALTTKKGRHDLPAPEGVPAFKLQPEIFHTFRAEEKLIGGTKSAIGTIGTLVAPWIVLLGLIPKATKQAVFASPPSIVYLFLATLAVLEALILKYWINWTLGPFLKYIIPTGLVSAYIGKLALGSLQVKRLSSTPKLSEPTVITKDTPTQMVTGGDAAASVETVLKTTQLEGAPKGVERVEVEKVEKPVSSGGKKKKGKQ